MSLIIMAIFHKKKSSWQLTTNKLFPFVIFRELAEFGSNKDSVPRRQLFAGSGTKPAIVFPPPVSAQWEEQVR
jgi:hypothetical protein